MNGLYCIYRVTTFAYTDKTQKGNFLKEYVNFLENSLFEGKLFDLLNNLGMMVDYLNKQFPRTKEWKVVCSGSQIYVEPKDNQRRAFDSQSLAVISFARVRTQLSPSDLKDMFSAMTDTYSHISKKGGEV